MTSSQTTPDPKRERELESLLDYLKRSRGFDFSGYKRSSLERRIAKRLDALKIESYGEYQDYVEVHPDEFRELFDTILINVTGFFRDEPAWRYLSNEVIPKLVEEVPENQPIRVWCAACATGEEAYTAAMVLVEALGEQAFLERVKIYATDVDEDALTAARQGAYPRDALKPIPEELIKKYWQVNGSRATFRSDLRRCVIFGRNDLVQDAPISRIDLLISRNALMYFIPETQARILAHFNFSLNPHGYLFLGKSEMLLTHGELFRPHSLKWRVFTKVPRSGIRERLSFLAPPRTDLDEGSERYAQLRDGAADTSPVAQIVIDRGGFLAFANATARRQFSIQAIDIGRPIQDLEVSYRPTELRTSVAEALSERRRVHLGRAQLGSGENERVLEVEAAPLNVTGDPLGVSVTFTDVTELVQVSERFEDSKRQLATAYEELQSTVEELETTNEELQSTNEELETTNEELQSTNEELETMNEELQSTNDELEAMNEQQRERSDEMDRLNVFLEGILGNLGVGVVVLDERQTVQVWNSSAVDLWGLRGDEVSGQHFLSLDIGLPVEEARDAIRGALGDEREVSTITVDAVNRRGRSFRCTVRALPLLDREQIPYGVMLLISGSDGLLPDGTGGGDTSE
ncbi:MAG TPA: CheR family methyltransferase [Solirubrobacteraceae bacterium]|nr:CheR family methyltransferase [Solirubrobacteraceae bacterium]